MAAAASRVQPFRVMLVLRNTDLDGQLKHPFWTAEACRIRIVVHWQVSPTSAVG
jgi:hypothetical protein